jgi:signal transduction histidine kinase
MWSIVDVESYAGLLLGYALLVVVAWRYTGRKERIRQPLGMAAALAAAWILAQGLLATLTSGSWWAFIWQRTAQIGLVILALVGAEFAAAFVQRTARHQALRPAIAMVFILAALILDVSPSFVSLSFSAIRLEQMELAGLILDAGWLLFTIVAWWIGAAALRQAIGAQHSNRIRYLLTALALITAGDALVLLASWPGVYVGLAMRLAGLALATIPVLRYRLPDIRLAFLRGAHYVALCSVAIGLLAGGMVLFSYASGNLERLRADVWIIIPALVAGTIAAVAIGPSVRSVLDRVLLGPDRDLHKALRRYSQQITLILDPERLGETTLGWLERTFGIRRSAFILVTPQSQSRIELRSLCSQAMDAIPAQCFSADSRFLVHFDKTGQPLSQYDLDMFSWFEAVPKDEQQWLRNLKVDLYVPVLLAHKLTAILALGPKADGRPYTDRSKETLTILAGQTGTALDNARLMDDLRRMQGDLHQLGDQLDETNRQLDHLDQTKADFVAIAAHELRTPLSQIYGYSDALSSLKTEDLSDSEAVHEFVQGISRGARRLKRVIDAMVDLSLLETGSLVLDPVTLPMGVAVKNATGTVMGSAEQRRIKLIVDDFSGLPYIQADSTRVEQALVAVLSNAIKFTPDGGQVTVSGRSDAPLSGQEYVEVVIADNGIGVDSEERELIFDKFYRAENPMLHSSGDARFKGAGPGLGLAIAKGIVEAHGGRIWVESPGRDEQACPGSTFYVRLPVRQRTEG